MMQSLTSGLRATELVRQEHQEPPEHAIASHQALEGRIGAEKRHLCHVLYHDIAE